MKFGMRNRNSFRGLFAWFSGLLCVCALGFAEPTLAAVTGLCSGCHTMHYSQDGTALAEWGDDGPYDALLTTDCGGCHMGTNAGGVIPFVFSSLAPSYGVTGSSTDANTLAGGNFYWVAQAGGDSHGHNIAGLMAADGVLLTPPGYAGGRSAADGSVPGGAILASDASPAGGFRMLVGIAGYEDSGWEYQPTATAHNQYKGVAGAMDNSTMSSLCAQCHGEFHSGSGAGSPWLRHPVDYDMGSTSLNSEYRGYGGETSAYRPDIPVASVNINQPLSQVSFAGDTIISCVSCHRAHGSPYHKMMRWDYAGSIGTGCTACHTSKD